MADMKANMHSLANDSEIPFICFGFLVDENSDYVPMHSGMIYPREVAVCFQDAEGDDIEPAMKDQGTAYAKKIPGDCSSVHQCK